MLTLLPIIQQKFRQDTNILHNDMFMQNKAYLQCYGQYLKQVRILLLFCVKLNILDEIG